MERIEISDKAFEVMCNGNIFQCGICNVYHHEDEMYFSHEPNAPTMERLLPFYRVMGWSVQGLMPMEGGIPLCPTHTKQYMTWMRINEFVDDRGDRPWNTSSKNTSSGASS